MNILCVNYSLYSPYGDDVIIQDGVCWWTPLPYTFLLFINDLIERCATYSEIYLFADDAKLFKHILSDSDQEMLQKGVDELYKWTIEWLLNLNISKCKVISFGRNADKTYMYKINDKDTDVPIERVDTIRDLGIFYR